MALDTRSNAIRSFEAQGYPTPRTKNGSTNLNRLAREGSSRLRYRESRRLDWSDLRVNGSSRIVILNGRYDAAASDIGEMPDGISIAPLSDAMEDIAPDLEGQLAQITLDGGGWWLSIPRSW